MTLIKKLKDYNNSGKYPFHMPGHKRRLAKSGILKDIYGIDITEIDDFDNLHEACGILKEAEEEAAKVFGAKETHFLVNGATVGILAAICGSCKEGDHIIMARNCHKSVYNAGMLSGANIHYIYPEEEAYFEVSGGISVNQVEEVLTGLADCEGSKLVVITSPTYEGVVSNIADIAKLCHENGAQLIVDSAHGAHFGFSKDFPLSAISQGADIVITSIHKTLPAPTQTALIHIADGCRSRDRVRKMLKVFMTSSPSYILMAGICECVEILKENADTLFNEYSKRLDEFYKQAEKLGNLSILTKDKLTAKGSVDFDKGKIVISDRSGKLSGKELYDILKDTYDLQAEMAAGGYVLLMTSIADTDSAFDRLTEALINIDSFLEDDSIPLKKRNILERFIDRIAGRKIRSVLVNVFEPGEDEKIIGREPLEARVSDYDLKSTLFADKTQWIPIELAEGKISADYIVPYPPCVPLVVPGEVLTGEIVDRIMENLNQNICVNGINSEKEIEVLWEK